MCLLLEGNRSDLLEHHTIQYEVIQQSFKFNKPYPGIVNYAMFWGSSSGWLGSSFIPHTWYGNTRHGLVK